MGTKAKYSPELRRELKKYCREAVVCLVSTLRKEHLPGCSHVEIPPYHSPLASKQPPPSGLACASREPLPAPPFAAGRQTFRHWVWWHQPGAPFSLENKNSIYFALPAVIHVLGCAQLSLQQQVLSPLERGGLGPSPSYLGAQGVWGLQEQQQLGVVDLQQHPCDLASQ